MLYVVGRWDDPRILIKATTIVNGTPVSVFTDDRTKARVFHNYEDANWFIDSVEQNNLMSYPLYDGATTERRNFTYMYDSNEDGFFVLERSDLAPGWRKSTYLGKFSGVQGYTSIKMLVERLNAAEAEKAASDG